MDLKWPECWDLAIEWFPKISSQCEHFPFLHLCMKAFFGGWGGGGRLGNIFDFTGTYLNLKSFIPPGEWCKKNGLLLLAGADPPRYPKLSWPFLLVSADFDWQNADLLIRKEAGSVHSARKPEKHHYYQIIGKKKRICIWKIWALESVLLYTIRFLNYGRKMG